MNATAELRRFLTVTGVVLTVIAALALVGGAGLHDVAGPGIAGADADARFAGALALGAAALYLHAARSAEIPLPQVRLLAGGLLLGGLARWLSILVVGAPGAWGIAQAVVETLAAVAVLILAQLHERSAG